MQSKDLELLLAFMAVHYPWILPTSLISASGGLENTKFIGSNATGTRFLLKIYRVASVQAVRTEIASIQRLSQNGVACQRPVSTQAGADVELFDGRPTCLFEFIEGREPAPNSENAENIGILLAQIHDVEPIAKLRQGYQYSRVDVQSLLESDARELSSDDRQFFADCLAVSSQIDERSVERRMCHCDIFLDNLVQDTSGTIHAIDFEEVSLETVLFDIGRAIVGCCRTVGIDKTFELQSRLLGGYTSRRALREYDLSMFHHAVVQAGMVSTYWRYRTFEIDAVNPARRGVYRELRDFTKSYLSEARRRYLL